MGEASSEPNDGLAARADTGRDDDLTIIREQTRETVTLLRQLVEMLLPKSDQGAAKLEDVLAELVTQQRETLIRVKQIVTAQTVLMDHLMGDDGPSLNGRRPGNGRAQA